MRTLTAIVKKGPVRANYLFSRQKQITEFTPIAANKKTKKKIRLFKLNFRAYNKPRVFIRQKEIKRQLLIANKLRYLFGFKNLKDTATAFNTSEANLNNLNSGKAGSGLSNAYRCVIAFAEEIPSRKRKKILANINFDSAFSNT